MVQRKDGIFIFEKFYVLQSHGLNILIAQDVLPSEITYIYRKWENFEET
jgi:hypothetical protein